MQEEVIHESPASPPRGGWRDLAFWLLATAGLALFALGLLAPPHAGLLEARRQLAFEEAKVHQVGQAVENLQAVCQWLSEDPKYLARTVRQYLGYRRPGDTALPFAYGALVPPLDEPVVEGPPETPLDRLARSFAGPPVAPASLAAGLMLMAVALLCFNVPSRRSTAVGATA